MARMNTGTADSILFEYDKNLIGDNVNDTEFADPDNNDFIWPEGTYRINTARWMDSNLGFNSPDRPVQLEVFTGKKIEMHVIHYRTEDEIKNDSTILEAPLYKAFHESPFNDVSIIDRETGRYLDAMDKTHEAFTAFRKSFNAHEQRLFEEWKAERSNGIKEPENTNFVQNSEIEEPRSVWELLSEATTEDLFKFKLDIFEQEVVQNSENRELRSKIRKAKSICEVCAAYQQLLDEETGSAE